MTIDFAKQYFGLNALDKKLEKWIDYDNGYFVELGANDGINQSNTYYYEKYRNWSGILVEPTPHNYIKCRHNRSKKNNIYCGACVAFEYKDEFVKMVYSNLMSTPLGLESDIQDPVAFAMTGKKYLNKYEDVFIYGAMAKTLNDILLESSAPKRVDLLSLDVEGAEIEVLKGIDHNEFKFRFMCIECRDLQKMLRYLMPLGYCLLEQLTLHDYLFAYKYYPSRF